MATLGGAWANSYALLQTTTGTYRAAYHPHKDGSAHSERVLIADPNDVVWPVRTPSLGGFALAVENGALVVWYLELPGNVERRVETGLSCGQPVAAHTFGGVGPMGPTGGQGPRGEDGPPGPPGAAGSDGKDAEVDEATMQRIAALTAEQVLLGGPAGDHYGLAPNAQFGTRHQENIAVMFTNQAFWQEVIKAIDTAALGLQSGGYTPKVQGG
jgi:hypothetical protein